MSILWAIVAAFGWGTADFLARIAAEKIGSRSTVFFSHLCSVFLLLLVLASTRSAGAADWPISALGFMAAAAVLNAAGMTLFYEALHRGPVSVVSPITSSFGGITAALALMSGERASGGRLAGLGAIVLGIAGSTATGDPSPRSSDRSAKGGGAVLATLVAALWGATFFLLTPAFSAFGRVLPILICRAVTVGGHAVYAVAGRKPWTFSWAALPVLVGVGVLDTGGFLAYGVAVQSGMTSVSVVIASLFSTITVLLAASVLGERLRWSQWAAVALLLVGIALAARR